MKKYVSCAVLAAALIAAVISCVCVFGLKEEIRQVENSFQSRISAMQSDYSAILAQVEERMEQQASILARREFTYGEVQPEEGTVELMAAITPKEYQPEVTRAVLVVEGREYPMELTDGAYRATVDIPIFEESVVEQVLFREGETVRTETLDWYAVPRRELLLSVSARISGEARGHVDDGVYVWHRTGEVCISVEGCENAAEIRSVRLIEELDGEEKARIEIPLTNTQSSDARRKSAVPEPAVRSGVQIQENFFYDWEREYSIPFGSTLNLFAEVEDENGLIYRVCADHLETDENGRMDKDDAWEFYECAEWIMDREGTVLYETNDETYQ